MKLPMSIREYLPHREPMLMVDTIVRLDSQFIETTFQIKDSNIFLENEYLNEIGIIENAAQTSSGIVGCPHFESNKHKEGYKIQGYISTIKSVKIHSLPPKNSILQTRGELLGIHSIDDIYNCNMKSETFIDDELVAQCFFNLIIKA